MIFEKYKLYELCDVRIGRTPPRKEPEWFNKGVDDYKWVSIKDMGQVNKYIDSTTETLSREAQKRFNIPIVKAGTLLLSFKLTIGRLAITEQDMLTNEAIAQLAIVRPDKIDTEYLYYYFKNYPWSILGNTSSIANAVNSKVIKNIEINIPPLDIQHRIVDILSTIDRGIDNNNKINENLAA